MSVQLRPDEALEALSEVDWQSAERWRAILCAATSAMGAELAKHYGCESLEASCESVAFGGICVPILPGHENQPFPVELSKFDDGGAAEWADDCRRLAEQSNMG